MARAGRVSGTRDPDFLSVSISHQLERLNPGNGHPDIEPISQRDIITSSSHLSFFSHLMTSRSLILGLCLADMQLVVGFHFSAENKLAARQEQPQVVDRTVGDHRFQLDASVEISAACHFALGKIKRLGNKDMRMREANWPKSHRLTGKLDW